ncbi:hypothetical protein Mapa_010741 [Marchantia paleacea]|nr:hypothetical protein Mapa_010741 [Marchantia paleacea]
MDRRQADGSERMDGYGGWVSRKVCHREYDTMTFGESGPGREGKLWTKHAGG